MAQIEYKDLLNAGVHFGHLTRKWDPRMAPYIFMEKNGIHIVDLNKTLNSLEQAEAALKQIVRSGKKIMFVATKKQAQEIVTEEAKRLKMPYVTDRWLGGMLTNFGTIRKSIKKMQTLEKTLADEEMVKNIAKRERLMLTREQEKLTRVLGGIADLTRLPSALFVVDVKREHIAISEARRLNIPVFAICDTNSNPDLVDFPVPGNDDAYKSISLLTLAIGKAIEEGLMERKQDKEDQRLAEEEEAKRQSDLRNEAEAAKKQAREDAKQAKEAEATGAPAAQPTEAPAAEATGTSAAGTPTAEAAPVAAAEEGDKE